MLDGFQGNLFTSLDFSYFTTNLIMALLCGIIISLFYRISYRGPHYSASFVQALIILSMVTALVIMVIGNNLARAFGLVGAMSIIRFRTAVKDTQDIVFIFFALAAGMAAGVGLKILAFFGSFLIGSVIFVLHKTRYAQPHKKEFLLQFQFYLEGEESPYLTVLNKYCKSHKLVNMQALGEEDNFELSFYIELKKKDQHGSLLRELNTVSGIEHVRLYLDDDQF
jgi:uncharacterized membrane protein YhiD involved in acid resistance